MCDCSVLMLTLICYRELLNCNWKKKDKEALSPNVCRLIKQTNEVRLLNEIMKPVFTDYFIDDFLDLH